MSGIVLRTLHASCLNYTSTTLEEGSALNLFYRNWRNRDVKTSRAQATKLAFDPTLPSPPISITTAWYTFSFRNSVLGEIWYLLRDPSLQTLKASKQTTNPKHKGILADTFSKFISCHLGIVSVLGHGHFIVVPHVCSEDDQWSMCHSNRGAIPGHCPLSPGFL